VGIPSTIFIDGELVIKIYHIKLVSIHDSYTVFIIFFSHFQLFRSLKRQQRFSVMTNHAISPGAMGLNLELRVKVFFSADSGTLGVAFHHPGG
jgi:hypothetical protein